MLKKKVIDELITSIEILKEQIEGSTIVLQNKNTAMTGENILKAAQIIATNQLAETNEPLNKLEK